MYIALTALLLCLGLLFFQDMKYRHIHVTLPVAVFLLSGAIAYKKNPMLASTTLYNAGFFVLILSILVLYMSIKNKQFSNPFENYFGPGDLLFYLAITPLFVLRDYVLFFIFSMLFAIVMQMALRKVMAVKTVPLAGFSALLLLLVVVKDVLFDFRKITLI